MLRIVPVDNFQARFWFVRARILLAWAIFGRITLELLVQLGLSPAAQLFLSHRAQHRITFSDSREYLEPPERASAVVYGEPDIHHGFSCRAVALLARRL